MEQPWTVPDDGAAPYDWLADTGSGLPGPDSPSIPPPVPVTPEAAPGASPPGSTAPMTAPDVLATDLPMPRHAGPGSPEDPAGPAGSPSSPAEREERPWASPPIGGEAATPPAPVPLDDPPLPGAPVPPDAPAWQPPPAFTAAAAGMHVWPSPASGASDNPPWPAATGEPVGESAWPEPEEPSRPREPGDVAVWPPHLAAQGPDEEGGEDTVKVRVPMSAGPEGQDGAPAQHVDAPAPPDVPAPQAPAVRPEPYASAPATPPVGFPAGDPPLGPAWSAGPGMPPTAPPPGNPPQGPAWSARPGMPPTAPPPDAPPPGPAWSGEPGVSAPTPGPISADHPTPPGGIPVVSPPVPIPVPPAPLAPGPPGGRPPRSGPGGPAPEHTALLPSPAPATGPPGAPGVRPVRGKAATVLAAAAVAIVVGGIGTGAFLAYRSSGSEKTTGAATSAPAVTGGPTDGPASSPAEPSPASTTMLNSELTDPGKMTLTDAFRKKVTIGGTTFTRVKTHLTQDCEKAASGGFATALRREECRRVLRATYVDSQKKYAVTTGVAVLPTRESAVAADQAKNLERNLWFRGLPGSPGSGAERVHIAGGYAAGLVWGRYIVFSYATFADGHTPTAKEKGLGKVSGAFRDQTAKVVERRVTG
ncbi:hypothetical protein GCM10010156_44270 [Planobispora rosea]|uniref:Uncharacterized protein n=2 Tax=Planobispora rosea TaxID=35762 RepID=A0A8J3WEL8_PLARO|nr:hypothetical protein GCM10010156_44270 [Planobispora rosea]GIH85982.1 hypothetical protein Pro02_43900 [Planobispora rosea]